MSETASRDSSSKLVEACAPRGESVTLAPASSRDNSARTTGNTPFRSFDPARGTPIGPDLYPATPEQVTLACNEVAQAFRANQSRSRNDRAELLEAIAANIATLGDSLITQACAETGLAPPRIATERDRTVFQLRMFARIVREGNWVEAIIDHGDPTRKPIPKPDVRRMLKPLGSVAVFGASNFPLAYSVAGGDTASALAAGCPVVVKGHSAHPLTGEMTARAVRLAVESTGFHPGTFSFLHAGGSRDVEVGRELVLNENIRAVGFTGSVNGGTALAALGHQRLRRDGGGGDPIPIFAEMGSVNPVVVLPGIIERSGDEVAAKLATSAVNSSGQMCTCPGLIFVIDGVGENKGVDRFIESLRAGMEHPGEMTMLTARTRELFDRRRTEVMRAEGVKRVSAPQSTDEQASHAAGVGIRTRATLFEVSGRDFARQPTLSEECFGPSAIVVRCESAEELLNLIDTHLPGSLTGSIFADSDERVSHTIPSDAQLTPLMRDRLEPHVGRLIYNGVPTGVEVCGAMVHSGPYPACTRPESSAVGASAIRRWCRPVCYQNVPDSLLAEELQEANPLRIARLVDGILQIS